MIIQKLICFQNLKFINIIRNFSLVNRVNITDPIDHKIEHAGFFYTIPEKDFANCFEISLKKDFLRLLTAFDDKSIIIRKPAIEIMNYIKASDLNMPVIRYLLYGKDGIGKTVQMAHVLHYIYRRKDWLLLYFPNVSEFLNSSPEMEINSNDETLIDTPTLSVLWLTSFLKLNAEFLEKYNPVTLKNIKWNQKEDLPSGSTWTEMINFVIGRPKYASDCIGILLREAREHAKLGDFKVFGAIRGINCLFDVSCKRDITGEIIPANRISVLKYWRRFVKNDWCNGAIISSVNLDIVHYKRKRESYYPKHLLGVEGIRELDPFIPIYVSEYEHLDVSNYLNFLNYNHWLTVPEAIDPNGIGRKEIAFLCDNHPEELFKITKEW